MFVAAPMRVVLCRTLFWTALFCSILGRADATPAMPEDRLDAISTAFAPPDSSLSAARIDSLLPLLRPSDVVWVEEGTGESVGVLVLTRGEERRVPLSIAAPELEERVELYIALLRDPGRTAEMRLRQVVDESAALRLGEILLAPCRDFLVGSPRLLILPGRYTSGLPWSTLRLRSGPEPTSPSQELLQLAHSISVTSYDRLMRELRGASAAVGPVGYEAAPRVLMEEKCAVARDYQAIDFKPARANLQRVLRRRHYDLLQLEASEQLRLELPYLQFDLAGEPPRLVLLCQPTLSTRNDAAELGNALLDAGASAVVTNLWPIDPWIEGRLLSQFYDALAEGQTVGSALMTAQRFLRQDEATRSPALWGGFSVLGDAGETVVLRRRFPQAWARGALGVGAALVLAFLFTRLRRGGGP